MTHSPYFQKGKILQFQCSKGHTMVTVHGIDGTCLPILTCRHPNCKEPSKMNEFVAQTPNQIGFMIPDFIWMPMPLTLTEQVMTDIDFGHLELYPIIRRKPQKKWTPSSLEKSIAILKGLKEGRIKRFFNKIF